MIDRRKTLFLVLELLGMVLLLGLGYYIRSLRPDYRPRMMMISNYNNRFILVLVLIIGARVKNDRILNLLCLNFAIGFLLCSIIIVFGWNMPDHAYESCVLATLSLLFVNLVILGLIAFENIFISLLIFIPVLLMQLMFFIPHPTMDGAIDYRHAFIGTFVATALVLFSYMAYQYVVKNRKISTPACLFLAGWFSMVLVSQLVTSTDNPFLTSIAVKFIKFKFLVYLFWLVTVTAAYYVQERKIHGRPVV